MRFHCSKLAILLRCKVLFLSIRLGILSDETHYVNAS